MSRVVIDNPVLIVIVVKLKDLELAKYVSDAKLIHRALAGRLLDRNFAFHA